MKKILIIASMLAVFASCNKTEPPVPKPTSPTDTISDKRTVLLKEVIEQKLPSPFFKFVYDENNFVTQVSFASGFNEYNVEYENKRVKKLTNIRHGWVMLYTYSNNRVSVINEFDVAGKKRFTYDLMYNEQGRLKQVNWTEFVNVPAGSLYKQVKMTYHTDGNLATMEKWYNTAGTLQLPIKQEFSDYDNTVNVDDFYLIEEFFDSFLYLPQVKMQLNNPRKHIILGDSSSYDITYTYQFNSQQLPVRKSGVMTQTKGTDQGKMFNLLSTFSYYE